MPRSYYLFRNVRLRRKHNTLYLETELLQEETSSEPEEQTDETEHPNTISFQKDEESAFASIDPIANETLTIEQTLAAESVGDSESNNPNSSESESDNLSKTFENIGVSKSDTSCESPKTAEKPRPIPIEDVNEIYLFGEITLNTKLLNFLAQKGIPVHVFNYHGYYSGSYYPRETNVSGYLLVKQVEHYTETAKRLTIAKEIERGSFHNLNRNLLYYRNRGKAVQDAIEMMNEEAKKIETADSITELMGVEGRIREIYYRAFSEILKLEEPFKRVKRPPDNMLNALISFCNSLLYSTVLAQIYRTPLNPTISFLHEPSTRRFSLALDIAEIFKPLIVDKIIFKLINKQMLNENDLMEEVGFAYLRESGRKIVVREFEEKLSTTIMHRRMGRNVSYRGFIRLECYKIVRHLLGIEDYKALRAWW